MNLPATLAEKAISLADLGVADLAWTRLDAFDVIDMLTASSVAILGGDVLTKENNITF